MIMTLVEQLLAMKRAGYLISSTDAYLLGFPEFLALHKMPAGFICTAGYKTIAIDHELKIKSCWAMKPIGDLRVDKLADVWSSSEYRVRREAMAKLKCPGCWYRCHTDEHSSEWLEYLATEVYGIRAPKA
jgi:MoaA/NifB/PqqE/SkfB family radical SAM enzyme